MKNFSRKGIFVFSIFLVFIFSCSKDSDSNGSNGDFMEITIGDKTYKHDLYSAGGGLVDQPGCVSKPHFLAYVDQFDLSDFFFDSNLMVLENSVDFKNSSVGVYKTVHYQFPSNACNLDLVITLDDNTQTNTGTVLQLGGTNTISSIKDVGSNSTEVNYKINGNFTSSFKNKANNIIKVTGKYQITIPLRK